MRGNDAGGGLKVPTRKELESRRGRPVTDDEYARHIQLIQRLNPWVDVLLRPPVMVALALVSLGIFVLITWIMMRLFFAVNAAP